MKCSIYTKLSNIKTFIYNYIRTGHLQYYIPSIVFRPLIYTRLLAANLWHSLEALTAALRRGRFSAPVDLSVCKAVLV